VTHYRGRKLPKTIKVGKPTRHRSAINKTPAPRPNPHQNDFWSSIVLLTTSRVATIVIGTKNDIIWLYLNAAFGAKDTATTNTRRGHENSHMSSLMNRIKVTFPMMTPAATASADFSVPSAAAW
jgi:hypothetical protein